MKHLTFLTLTVLFFQLPIYPQPSVPDSIRLTAIGAPWDVVIEGDMLDIKNVGTKADGSYFLLFPSKTELNISFYIEPAAKCKTSEQCRDFVLNAGNPAWGKFEGLTKSNFGDFSYFEFFRPEVQGRPLKMQDMYAQYVDKGYWVDLHISKVLYKKADKALFEKLLTSVKFVPKSRPTDFDKFIEPVTKVAEDWLGVWGAKKCKESYNSLTSISREAIKENQWVEYCTAANENLGKLRSRNLIATTTTRSLPGKPGISGAAFRFQSEFENRSGVEFISFTQEKDGNWTVSNYLVQ